MTLNALMTLNHTMPIFVLDEPAPFTDFAVFDLYALIVLAIPFRRLAPGGRPFRARGTIIALFPERQAVEGRRSLRSSDGGV
jgi:hypothetical protein